MSLARHNPLSIFHQQQEPSLPRLDFSRQLSPELSPQSLKQLGIKGVDAADVLQTIKTVYGITEE